jgi:SAM-dependent methyltransferase
VSDKADKEAKRKRRRRAGLRVPSDNVPRAKSNSDVAAPAPEDPRLAVSVAYAFSNGGSALDVDSSLDGEAGIRDTIRNVPRPAELDGDGEVGALDLDDLEELDSYEGEMTVANAEHPVPPERDVVAGEVDPAAGDDDETSIGEARGDASDLDTVVVLDGGDPDLSARTDPDLSSQAHEASVAAAPGRSTDSVDIAFDDEDAGDATSPPADTRAGSAAEVEPAGQRRRFLRARTVALTDQDLEELMEGDPLDAEDDLEGRVTGPMSAIDPGGGGEVAAAADSAPSAPIDASDSGEIIADDMIEEIEENALARAVALEDEEQVVESSDALDELEAEELPPEAASEPPPPPRTRPKVKTRPPPAPASAEPPMRRRSKGKGKPWFEEVFDENYLRTLPFLTPQATEAEADFVIDSLALEAGAQILDVGCGYGRHSMELAARGFHMVGLDLSLPLLLRGADEAQRRGLDINFIHGDMREMQFDAQFDGAFCLFSTFGYFDDETNKVAAQNIARALKPGAKLVLEVLNRDYLIRDLPTRVWWEGDGCVVLEEVDFNYFSSRIVSTRSIAFEDGRQIEQEISIRAFALHELGKLLHAAGFRVVEVSGSMVTRGRFFGAMSRDILVVAEKRGGGNGHG